MKKKKFGLVLIEKPGEEGLNAGETARIFEKLSEGEAYPMEIYATEVESSAMGFIAVEAAKSIDHQYDQKSQLGGFISDIMNDMDKESDDGIYTFENIDILLTRNI